MKAVSASVYDAIYTSVAERIDVSVDDVHVALAHLEIPDDGFWAAWDETVSEAVQLFCSVTGREYDPLNERGE